MDSGNDNQEVLYCDDYRENRVNFNTSDKLCIERFYKNHFKSQTHNNDIRKKRKTK